MSGLYLYRKIEEEIKDLITSGKIKDGEKIPSVSDIRSKYKVSHITALRVMKDLSNENYIEFVKGKGYFARGLSEYKQNGNKPLGIILCILRPYRPITLHDNYYNEINMAVQRECMQKSFNAWYPSCNMPLEEQHPSEKSLEMIRDTVIELIDQADGCIIDDRVPDSFLSRIMDKTDKPVIVVNRKTNLNIDAVIPDNVNGPGQAADLALKMGYKTFVVGRNIMFMPSHNTERTDSFIDRLKSSGISDKMIHEFEYNITPYEETLEEIETFLKLKHKTLIFTPTDSLARVLADEFTERGIKLGETLGILGFEGMGYATMNTPHLTTVNIHPEKIGQKAVDILIGRINGNSFEKTSNHIIPSTLSMGETL